MQKYCNKIRVAAYVTEEIFERIEEKRQKTKETQSGIIAGILDEFFAGDYNADVQT